MPPVTPQSVTSVLKKLFGASERTVVLIVDQDKNLVDYSVKPLEDVIAELSLQGFSTQDEEGAL